MDLVESTMTRSASHVATDLLFMEADALDTQNWDGWLNLYCEDVSFWVPTWITEHKQGTDPETEVSMIYHVGRSELEERVSRIRSRKSVTALPLPRTVHMFSNILVRETTDSSITFQCNGQTSIYDVRLGVLHQFIARYRYVLRRDDGQWRIASKFVTVINDRVPTVLDFYCI